MPRKKKTPVRGDGRFQVKLVVGYKSDGSPKYKFFYSYISKADCERQKQEYMAGNVFENPKEPAVSGALTLDQWSERWFMSYKSALSEYSKDMYKRTAKGICNYCYHGIRFGSMQVQAFLPIHLAEYMSSLVGKSKSIVTKNRATLIGLFSTAYDNGLINVEITRNFPKIVGTYTGHKALDRADISLITTNYQLHEAGLGMMIMLWAGLRKGEAVALCWEDIDFERNVIHVTKSHDIVHNVTKGPKTQAGVRDVPMFAVLRQALLSKRQKSGLVFPKKSGGLHTCSSLNLAIRSFCSFIERVKNGVPHPERAQGFRMDVWQKRFAEQGREWEEFSFTAHDLRTTFATMCYDAGVDLHTAKRWMGHSSVETTLSIYTKLSNERRVESTDAMDAYSAALTG